MTIQPNAAAHPKEKAPAQSLDKFFLENRVAGQAFVLDPARHTTLVGHRGTRLAIAPNAFLDHTGWQVREPVTLMLREVFTRAEMILSGLTNTSEDRILGSAGQINLQAQAGTGLLQLAAPLAVDLPLQPGVDNPLATQLFSGGVSRTSSFGAGLRFDWKAAPARSIQLRTLGDKKYLHFAVDELNWWNCTSFFPRRRGRIMLSARWTAAEAAVSDLAAFLVFRDFNAVVRMYPSRHGFSSWNIPKDLTACAILIGMAPQGMLIGRSAWAPTSNQPVQVHLESCSKEELLGLIPEWCA